MIRIHLPNDEVRSLEFCRKLGIRVYRPTYRFLRGDPVKQDAARAELAELKKS